MDNSIVPDGSVALRVRRILEDLAFLRAALVEGDAQTGAVPPVLELQLAAELKSSVDSIRQLLRLYMRARCSSEGVVPQQITDWYKMELAVEMLRLIRNRPTQTEAEGNVVEMIPSSTYPPFRHGDPHA